MKSRIIINLSVLCWVVGLTSGVMAMEFGNRSESPLLRTLAPIVFVLGSFAATLIGAISASNSIDS